MNLVAKERSIAERALVIWDALEDPRLMVTELAVDLRQLAAYATSAALAWREAEGDSTKRHRQWLARGGVAWSRVQSRYHEQSPTERKLGITPGTDRHGHRLNVYDEFMMCAFCSFLLLPVRRSKSNGITISFRWSNWNLAVARAHTDRCAMRFLIRRGK